MGRKHQENKAERAAARSLEQQLRELEANEVPGTPVKARGFAGDAGYFVQPSPERVAWAKNRHDKASRLRRREAKRLADPGPDQSGNYGPTPAAARGHVVEIAPKDLGTDLPKHSAFPKRVATQCMIDRYKAQGLITARQWRAGDRMYRLWRELGREPALTAGYSPDRIKTATDPDAKMVGRSQADAEIEACRALMGVLGFDLIEHVIRWGMPAGEWKTRKAMPNRRRMDFAMEMLRQNLEILARHFRY